MAQYTTEAILLAVRNFGEADKIVTFFSRDLGKIRAVAYGCRRMKSPLAGGMQVFSCLRLTAAQGANLDTIRQCETKLPHKELREELECMAYASFLAELTAQLCPERHPEADIYDLLLTAFRLLAQKNPRLVALTAAYRILAHTGSQPEYRLCVACGREAEEDAFFSPDRGGCVCKACNPGGLPIFSARARELVERLIHFDWEKPAPFRVYGAALLEAESLLLDYLLFLLEKPLKSLAFIRQLALLPKG